MLCILALAAATVQLPQQDVAWLSRRLPGGGNRRGVSSHHSSLQLFLLFFWYSTKSVQYKYYHSSTVNSLQKNLVPRNLQPSPDKKKLLPSLRTLFTNQLPAITPRDAATRAMRGCVERVARVSDQHFFSFPTFFLKS